MVTKKGYLNAGIAVLLSLGSFFVYEAISLYSVNIYAAVAAGVGGVLLFGLSMVVKDIPVSDFPVAFRPDITELVTLVRLLGKYKPLLDALMPLLEKEINAALTSVPSPPAVK